MLKHSCLIASVALLVSVGSARADFVASGPTLAPTGNFGMPRIDIANNTAGQTFFTVLTQDMLFFQFRVSETNNTEPIGLAIEFWVDDGTMDGVVDGSDTKIGMFSDANFNDGSPATALYEWKLDLTTANSNSDQFYVVISSGTPVGAGQENGVERISFSTVSAVPEPSAFLYGGVVAAIAGVVYRRRQQTSV